MVQTDLGIFVNSCLANIIYGKHEPDAQFLVHYEDFLAQNMAEWCLNTVGNMRSWKARKLIEDTAMVPIWFKRDIDAMAFKLAFTDYAQQVVK